MRPTQKSSIMLAMSLVLAAACGGNDDDSSVEASPTTAVRTRPADMTEASASTESRARDETAESAVPATLVAANGEGSTYVTETFLLPFDVTVPGWLPNAPSIDWPNFVTWETTSPADPAVRFLVPVNVFAPGATGPTPPPQDYLAYLLAQTEHGANFADISEVTVGGLPATLMTATTAEHLDGSLGCQAEALTAHDCFGLQPDLSLRIAVIDAGDTTLVTWLRHDRVAGSDETTDEFASFEQMLATVQFRDHNERTSVPSTVPAATAIDGVWTTTLTYDELANSPLLYDQGEVNDGNWGEQTFVFKLGRFTISQKNPRVTSSISGTFQVEGDTVVLTNEIGERFVMRWSLEADELTFERDEALGIAPTPFIVNPWTRQP